jgi:hypothetical protein
MIVRLALAAALAMGVGLAACGKKAPPESPAPPQQETQKPQS